MVKTVHFSKKRKVGSTTKGKHRDRSPQSGDEVNSARDRFKGALQDLLPHTDEDSESTDDDQWNPKKELCTPKKRRQPQQTTEKQAESEPNSKVFVMKLYDRVLDLAQFDDITPLYPICRAWIANTPQTSGEESAEVKEEDNWAHQEGHPMDVDYENIKDIHRLPAPEAVDNDKIRIPDLVPFQTKYSLLYQEGVDLPSRGDLLNEHLDHWKKVRRNWLEASIRNELRYQASTKILSAIYNKSQQSL